MTSGLVQRKPKEVKYAEDSSDDEKQVDDDDTPLGPPKPFNTDVEVRLLKEGDSTTVLRLLYDHSFFENAKEISRSLIKSKLYLAFVAASSFLIYFHLDSWFFANAWFISWIVFAYLFMMYFVCRRNYFSNDVDTGSPEAFSKFWSGDGGRYMWIATQDFKIVGAVGLVNADDGKSATLRRVVVDPSSRRKGVASQLMLSVLDHSVFHNLDKVEMSINHKHSAAQKLLKKFGFRTSLNAFFHVGVPPFFQIRSAKYTLSLEKIL